MILFCLMFYTGAIVAPHHMCRLVNFRLRISGSSRLEKALFNCIKVLVGHFVIFSCFSVDVKF